MGNKFNTDFLKGNQPSTPTSTDEVLSKFKSTAEIFDKANSMIDIIPVDKLIYFSNHPFKIRTGERLTELTDSLKMQGILVPLIVRCHPNIKGSYEILAGHHRYEAAKLADIFELPCIIKNVDDNTSALIVVESNKQRGFADMLPSEIAKALKLEYDALKCQGKRTDLFVELEQIINENFTGFNATNTDTNSVDGTSAQVEQKLETSTKVADKNGMSSASVRRYIRLNNLTQPLLDLIDNNSIAIIPAVDLSFLNEDEQNDVFDTIEDYDYKVDMKKSAKLKEYSYNNKLNLDTAKLILSGAIFEVKVKKITSINLPYKKIKEFIDTSLSASELETYVVTALEFYQKNNVWSRKE